MHVPPRDALDAAIRILSLRQVLRKPGILF